MVKPQRQTDKVKKATKDEQDFALPPPLQLQEKKLATSTPAKQGGDSPEDAVRDKLSQSGAKASGSNNDSFDEDTLDHEIAETEKSIRETQARLDDLEKATRVQSKRDVSQSSIRASLAPRSAHARWPSWMTSSTIFIKRHHWFIFSPNIVAIVHDKQ